MRVESKSLAFFLCLQFHWDHIRASVGFAHGQGPDVLSGQQLEEQNGTSTEEMISPLAHLMRNLILISIFLKGHSLVETYLEEEHF